MKSMKLIFEKSRPGRAGVTLPPMDVPAEDVESLIPAKYLRKTPPQLPEVSEQEVVRHYVQLSHRNMSVDEHFYPLGSCTMKYNPKINERCARLPGFCLLHPLQPESTVQGMLQLQYELEQYLAEIAGMDAATLQPAAGAQGELTGLLLIRAWHKDRGQDRRDQILIPDSAHGTNPASCTMVGYRTITVKTNKRGCVDLDDLKSKLGDRTAGIMITNPNTLGIFEENILEITELVHKAGGLVYMDGANMNAILGITRPGDFGADVMHYNFHKTFSIPHGGGGPGACGVACKAGLEPYLPVPRIVREGERFRYDWDRPKSIGKVTTFFGNMNNLVRGYAYIRGHGREGLKRIAQMAVLNANYLLFRLKEHFFVPFKRRCMHEFVIAPYDAHRTTKDRQTGPLMKTMDIAKRLIDYGYHPPTIYFPLIVPEAMMIEPTESESRQTLDEFARALLSIKAEAMENPELLHNAPHTTPVKRLDEVKASREPRVRWTAGSAQ